MKFVEGGAGLIAEPLFGLSGFLNWVLLFLAVGRPAFAPFKGYIVLGEVDADEGHANWIAAAALELRRLIDEVGNDAIDLLDHCFGKDLCLGANLNRGDGTTGNEHSLLGQGDRGGDELAKSSIAAPGRFTGHQVLQVHNTLVMLNALDQLIRFVQSHEVLI
ncbi:MAG: hypothetical protein ABI217_10155 [Chthoniobacterales bacterium]